MPLPFASTTVFVIAIKPSVGVIVQFGGVGVAVQSGGLPPVGYATLPISVTPAGIGFATVTTTVSASVPFAGTVSPVHVTMPPESAPPLLAETNVTFGSSGSVTP